MIKAIAAEQAGQTEKRQDGVSFPKWLRKVPQHLLLLVLMFAMLLPFFWMIGMSLKTDVEATPNALDGGGRDIGQFSSFFWPQKGVQPENYADAWYARYADSQAYPNVDKSPLVQTFGDNARGLATVLAAPFAGYYFNSIVAGLGQVFAVLITSALAAYAFARLEFYGKNVLFVFLLATLTIPSEATYIPNLVIVTNLGLTNTLGALILPWAASVFSIFLMRQFFMTIPQELYDAGQIDGLSELGYLWRVALPLASAAVLTSALFAFMGNWNSLLWPLIASPKTPTVQLGLQTFISNGETQTQWNLLMAASMISILPIVIIYFLVQRQFIDGIARSGIK